MTHEASTRSARVRRPLLSGLAALLVVLATALPAAADTPETWNDSPDVSGLDFLLVLVLIPLGLAVVISLLAVIPSFVRDKGYEPGQTWRSEPEWFGGTRVVEPADEAAPAQLEAAGDAGAADRGGASGQW